MRKDRLNPKGTVPKGFTERKCMCCTKPFASEGIHNRLCPPCKNTTRGIAQITSTGRRVRIN